MKNAWWEKKEEELQADTNDMKFLHEGLCAVYSPKSVGKTHIHISDQTTLQKEKNDIFVQLADHFHALLNRESTMVDETITALPQLPVNESLSDPPSASEMIKALEQTMSGKATGLDGIPADIYKQRPSRGS